MHPRLTLLAGRWELDAVAAGGAQRVGLSPVKVVEHGLDSTLESLDALALAVTHVVHAGMIPIEEPDQLERGRAAVTESVDIAIATNATVVYGPTGGAPSLEWEEAARIFVDGIGPVAAYARDRAIALLIEPTISLVADMSILNTLRDTVELAERADIGVCIDVQHCWTERGLRDAIQRAAPRTGLVQISDWILGNRQHFRAVPGDGAIPLERILGWILETGYTGLFDLEITPEPGIPAAETVARALERAGTLLERLGVAG
jgi:sugar phosphate isomerase/epimerase